MSEMRIVMRWLPRLLLAVLCLSAPSCRYLVREVFQNPTVKLVDVGISGNPFLAPRAPLEAVLHLRVTNPNTYALTVSQVSYSATIGSRRVASGEKNERIRIEPDGDTIVRIPVQLVPDAFAAALREVLAARALSYEFNGSVGVVAPLVGTVRVPFSRNGTVDPVEFLRRKGIGLN
jgi:LEA14-like dessication related protein